MATGFSAWFGVGGVGTKKTTEGGEDLYDYEHRNDYFRRSARGRGGTPQAPRINSNPSAKRKHWVNAPMIQPPRKGYMERKQPLPSSNNNNNNNNEMNFDAISAQSSITNSWTPKVRPYFPPPSAYPARPIENMVITVKTKPETANEATEESTSPQTQDNNTNERASQDLQGQSNNNQQQNHQSQSSGIGQDVVFKGWSNSNSEMNGSNSSKDGSKRGGSWWNKQTQPNPATPSSVARSRSRSPTPHINNRSKVRDDGVAGSGSGGGVAAFQSQQQQSIEDAMKELQELTGMEVKCLDEDNDKKMTTGVAVDADPANDLSSKKSIAELSSVNQKLFEIQIDEQLEAMEKQKDKMAVLNENQDYSTSWIFSDNKRDELKESDPDELRLRKQREDQEKILDTLDDLEGANRLQEARRRSSVADDQQHSQNELASINENEVQHGRQDLRIVFGRKTPSKLVGSRRMVMLSKQASESSISKLGMDSPTMEKPKISEKLSGSLARFELPSMNTKDDDDNRSRGPFGPWNLMGNLISDSNQAQQTTNDKEEKPSTNRTQQKRFSVFTYLGGENLGDEIEASAPIVKILKTAEVKKASLIVDKEKRDSRWRLNQKLIGRTLQPYSEMIAKDDEHLPTQDAFNTLAQSEETNDGLFHEIRDKMLEDGDLSEREIAAFFQGVALFGVKVRSLESQLGALQLLRKEEKREIEALERKWDDANDDTNLEALQRIRRHMPLDIKDFTEDQLCTDRTPNGKLLPRRIAKKFIKTNILQLIRTHPDEIAAMHPSTLENLRTDGLTLSERRALHYHLKTVGVKWKAARTDDPLVERKWQWYRMMKETFKESLNECEEHCKEGGPPDDHECDLMGKNCPVKADKMMDYVIDYGHPEDDEYEIPMVRRTTFKNEDDNAMIDAADLSRVKRASLRHDALKKYYKGKALLVALASGSCEAMDAMIDQIDYLQYKWIEYRLSNENEPMSDDRRRVEALDMQEALEEVKIGITQFAERAGMHLTGKKDTNAELSDIRSPIELGLCEEVWEHANDFFSGIEHRVKFIDIKNSMIKTTITQLRDLLEELHDRNMKSLNTLGVRYPEPSRQRKTRREIIAEVRAKLESKKVGETLTKESGPSFGRQGNSESNGGAVRGQSVDKARHDRSINGATESKDRSKENTEGLLEQTPTVSSNQMLTKDDGDDDDEDSSESEESESEGSDDFKKSTPDSDKGDAEGEQEDKDLTGPAADAAKENVSNEKTKPPVSKYLAKKALEKSAGVETEEEKEDSSKRPVSKYLARKAAMEKEGEGNAAAGENQAQSRSPPTSVRRGSHIRTQRGRDDRPRRASTTIAAASTEDRLAAIAARRQNIRESIAARKKAKEEAAS